MGPFDFLNHLLNFVAPAAWMAVCMALSARIFMKKRPLALVLYRLVAINFIVCLGVLAFGMWLFGNDGKLATYASMALLCATSQWLMQRGWRS